MRKVFVLAILFSMSFAMQAIGLQTETHTSVLVAIGFVILCAYTLSEIGSSLTLPRVTGYILTGLLLGPYALNILSSGVVQEIEMFNTLAIGLIAVTAGLELHFSSLRKVILAISTTTVLKIIFLCLLAVGSFFAIEQFTQFFAFPDTSHLIAISLVFGVLCLGTSPAISLAVISETKAKGRISQLVLGSAIVKDVVVVICLALAVSFANSMIGESSGAEEMMIHLAQALGLSLLAGLILGAIYIIYMRFIQQEMFLFIAVTILATAEIAKKIPP